MDKHSLNRFFLNESTGSEREKAIQFLLNPENDGTIRVWMKENWDLITDLAGKHHTHDPVAKNIWLNIQQKIKESNQDTAPLPKKHTPLYTLGGKKAGLFAAAAAVLIVVLSGLGYYLFYKPHAVRALTVIKTDPPKKYNDIAPPLVSKAVLTLADGKQVLLDSSGNGTIASQGNVSILKKSNGEIVYTGSASADVGYNTLSLPKGSKPFRLVLADGTLVWLNAASSITYPTAFIGDTRKVAITGEAYFEVAKNTSMPFHVSHSGVLVKVTGTHFNVNTYEDEKDVKVTLLEGAVDVLADGKSKRLRPGQQARVAGGSMKMLDAVDINEVMAWKNGQFYFAGTNIKSIMRQIEKYYDVEVEYKDNVPYQFVAKISRQVNVSEFLQKLELTNLIHFKIEGKKIIVTK
jgi:hypothetical protein